MKAWTYKRLMPKVLIARLQLIEPTDLVDLVGRSVEYIASALARTPYHKEIAEIPEPQLSVISIEEALLRNYIKTCQEIMEYSPKEIGFLLSTFLMKFEVDNIKAMLRAKWAGIGIDEAMRFITPIGRLDERKCRNVLENSESVSDVVELLSDLEYGTALKDALKDHEETGTLLPFEVALYTQVYGQITRATRKLKGKDRKIAEIVLGIEIESMNMKVILRGKSLGIARDQIIRSLLPMSDILNEKALETAVDSKDITSSIKSLLREVQVSAVRDYQYLLSDLLKEYDASQSISQLEIVLDRNRLKASLRMVKRYTPYFNIGLVLSFLNTKRVEVKNLRAIVRGAEDRVPPERITELLILAN
jgi:V/A-type H+-transporting ATPase subunit C